jgi:flagellar basal body-associated protein FliL
MKNKRILILSIALVLFALVVGTAFAASLNNGTYGTSSTSRPPVMLGYKIEWIKVSGNRLEFYDGNWKRILAVTARGNSSMLQWEDVQGRNGYLTIIDSSSFNFGGVRFFQYSDD